MSDEKKKSIPKPTIKPTAPAAPPVTSVDTDQTPPPPVPEEKPVEAENDENEVTAEESPEVQDSTGVETDLVKRFLGALIDGIIAGVAGAIVGEIADSSVLNWLVFAVIFLTRDSLPMLDGQSPGKKVMKTKAVNEDGSSLSGDWATGATRNILLAIPFVGLVECFIILSRSGRPGAGMRLGDDWAKTKVISLE